MKEEDIKILNKEGKQTAETFVLEKIMNKWIKEQHPSFTQDLTNLSTEIVMFNAKYGTKITAEDILS